MRILHFNEGNHGSHILGQKPLDASLKQYVATSPNVEMRFCGATPIGRGQRAALERGPDWLKRSGLAFSTLRWHTLHSLRARAEINRQLSTWPADVVNVQSQSVGLLLASLARRVPVSLSADATVRDWWEMPAWRREGPVVAADVLPSEALERRAFRYASVVLAWTEWARRAIARTAPGANVVEHHPGLDLTAYRPAARSARSRPRVLFVGGRFVEKGGEDLLTAVSDLLGSTLDLDLVTPVDVPSRPGVRVHRLNTGDPRLLDLQRQADVFCLPTYGDAAPWAVLEAMASGTPVISSPVGAVAELLGDGEAGVLVPYGRPAELREALLSLLSDEARRTALGAAGRKRCEKRYDGRIQGRRMVSLFEQTMASFR